MPDFTNKSFFILKEKLVKLLTNNRLALKKNSKKDSCSNQKNIDALLKSISTTELQKYKILLENMLEYDNKKVSNDLFEEFSIIFTKLKENNLETKYLEKVLKNFSEEDYSDSIVNVGKAIESLSKSILDDEEEKDGFNVLLHHLLKDEKITEDEFRILEDIRDCRNDNAHGNEVFIEISKEDAEDCILVAFEMMKNILSRL